MNNHFSPLPPRTFMAVVAILFLLVWCLGCPRQGHAQQSPTQISLFAQAAQGITGGSATATGQGGGASLYYYVVARFPSGLAYSQSGAIVARNTPGESNLSVTNPVVVSWQGAAGATGYDVLRRTSPSTPSEPCNACTVALNVQGSSVTDTGGNVGAYPPPGLSGVSNVNGVMSIDNQSFSYPSLRWSLLGGTAVGLIKGSPTPGQLASFNSDGTLSGASGTSGDGTVFTTLGVGAAPEQGSLFEVKVPGSLPITAAFDIGPVVIFAGNAATPPGVIVLNTSYSQNAGDGLNLYQTGSGTVEMDISCGVVGTCMDMFFNPTAASWEVDGPLTSTFNFTDTTNTTKTQTSLFAGTGVSQPEVWQLKAFIDPDAGGGSTISELEVFQYAVADATSGQAGVGTNFATYGRNGVSHAGYRFGTNAIYSGGGNTFVSNGFTLYDYANAENIFIASTINAHTFQLGNDINMLIPNIKSTTGQRYVCVTTAGTLVSSASACSGT